MGPRGPALGGPNGVQPSDNARKFTKKGTVTLSAKALPGTDSWMIEVEDTGIGIAENHLQRIMDPFEQILNNPKNTSRPRDRFGAGHCQAFGGASRRHLERAQHGGHWVQVHP